MTTMTTMTTMTATDTLHVTCKVGLFRSAFAKAAKICPARSPKPVLENVLLSASDDPYITEGSATFGATNLEIGLTVDLVGATILSAGRCLLPTRIGAALASLPADSILDLSVRGDHIHLSAPGWKSKLNSENPDHFPAIPGTETGIPFASVGGGDLKTAVARTTYATDEASTRYSLGGCCVERDVDGSRLVIVATDGRRLVKATIPADLPSCDAAPLADVKPVIPKRSLELMAGLIDEDAVVDLRLDDNRAVVASQNGWSVYTRLVEGRYPSWRDVFPSESSAVIRANVNAAQLLATVRCVSEIACSDESRGIDLRWTEDGLDLASESSERGQSDGRVDVEYETVIDGLRGCPEGGVVVTMDHRYLAELLRASAPETIRFDAIDHKNALIVRGDGDAMVSCLMPLTRDR